MPPSGSAEHRPIEAADVSLAWDRRPTSDADEPSAVGIDVARSGDRTVMSVFTATNYAFTTPNAGRITPSRNPSFAGTSISGRTSL